MTTQGMTERDKKLLYMLGFIVIIFLFIIIADRPLFRKIRETNKEIAKEQETHDTIELKLSRMELINAYKEQIDSKVSLYSARYYPVMDSTQIDDLLTGYVLSEGLKAMDLYINMPNEAVVLPAYAYSEAAKENSAASGESGSPDQAQVDAFTAALSEEGGVDVDESASHVLDTSLSGVYAAEVSLTAFGGEQKLKSLVEKLYRDQSLRVEGYQWQDSPGQGFSYIDGELVEMTDADRKLNVQLQVLMYDENAYVSQTETVASDEE